MGTERDLDALAQRLAAASSRLKSVPSERAPDRPLDEVDPAVALRRLEEAGAAVRAAREHLAELHARLASS